MPLWVVPITVLLFHPLLSLGFCGLSCAMAYYIIIEASSDHSAVKFSFTILTDATVACRYFWSLCCTMRSVLQYCWMSLCGLFRSLYCMMGCYLDMTLWVDITISLWHCGFVPISLRHVSCSLLLPFKAMPLLVLIMLFNGMQLMYSLVHNIWQIDNNLQRTNIFIELI